MSPLLRGDFVELGLSVPTDYLTKWASDQVAATKGRESRLELRGIGAPYLSELRELIGVVGKRQHELGESQALPPQAGALAERIRVEALAYWREAKRLAQAAFASEPDVLAKFRTGVQTGLLILNLVRELESMVALLHEHSAEFSRLGANQGFIARGETLIKRLKEVKVNLDAACRELPEAAQQQCHDKGLLYDRTRLLVRVGRLEFHLDPAQAAHFNFTLIRRDRGTSTGARLNVSRGN
ncbi:MAG TPA: hypothetical protein VMU54_03970 [Planctomycetota bacterium]|nr:hypothetical protein [Planctomycetota bacterium]